MKLKRTLSALLVLAASGVALTETTHDSSGHYDLELREENVPTIQKNYEGWVNPEDLAPMPQCIAQQDQAGWLNAMTKCTRHRCIHYFIVCTYFQWLTELSCLSAEFSPTTVEPYMQYCSRSVLAKAQLANWIKQITGRNWLVHAGDTSGLQDLSPRSLTQGYKVVSIEQNAPTCLKKAKSQSDEPFDHVLGSCSFTGTTLHNGNAARPWEYSTARESITALSFDTAGYDLTSRRIPPGDYFDKECFCNHFSVNPRHEPCSDQLELTKERLWLNAICGSSKLPENWKKSLKIVGVDFIPPFKWARSSEIPNMPHSVTGISLQCRTEACNTDSEGFCQLEPAIDRTCVCGKLNYSLCEGPCQSFESRTKYIEWLRALCNDVEGWHGLPDNWRDLLTLQRGDMIPWNWNLRPQAPKEGKCPSYPVKIASIAVVNLATFVAMYLGEKCSRNTNSLEPHAKNPVWVLRGLVLAAVQLAGNWANVKFVQSTPGYETIPIMRLMLLWCSLPRLGWIVIAPARIGNSAFKDLVAACSGLYAEVFLQIPNMYYMTRAVIRGLQHFFYFGFLPDRDIGYCAWLMYGGALLWLVSVALLAVTIIRMIRPVFTTHTLVFRAVEEPLRGHERPIYGTIPAVAGPSQPPKNLREPHLSLYVVLTIGLPVIYLAQGLFWIGFTLVSGENYCPPSLAVLTSIWMACSLIQVALKFVV